MLDAIKEPAQDVMAQLEGTRNLELQKLEAEWAETAPMSEELGQLLDLADNAFRDLINARFYGKSEDQIGRMIGEMFVVICAKLENLQGNAARNEKNLERWKQDNADNIAAGRFYKKVAGRA